MYQEAIHYGSSAPAVIDPTGRFLNKVIKSQLSYKKIKNALKREKRYLNKYLQEQDKMVERVKLFRARDKKE